METRFRRYLALSRPPLLTTTNRKRAEDELDLPRKAPTLSSTSPKKGTSFKASDDLDGCAIRAFAYETIVAGAPPVLGGQPLKGNGPVKLQTSRRLSSGELLVTTQDHQRTLADIREGGYIVGRKEPRRSSRNVEGGSPNFLANGPPSSRSHHTWSPRSAADIDASSLQLPTRRPLISPEVESFISTASPPLRPTNGRLSLPWVESFLRGSHSRTDAADRSCSQNAADMRVRTVSSASSGRTSSHTRGVEQKATVQALWKAESTRLEALYSQDRVGQIFADLDRDRDGDSPPDSSTDEIRRVLRPSSSLQQPHQRPLLDNGKASPSLGTTQSSAGCGSVNRDDTSDCSVNPVCSIMSSEESSSSCTRRTSSYDPDITTTREDVRRIVEDMRSTYLQAIEAKAAEQGQREQAERARIVRQRASYSHAVLPNTASPPLKASKPGHHSWHAGNTTETSKFVKKRHPKKKAENVPRLSEGRSSPSKSNLESNLESRPTLARADSATLGPLAIASGPAEQGTPTLSLSTSLSTSASAFSTGKPDDTVRPSADSTTPSLSSPRNTAPDVDDCDVYYQDHSRTSLNAQAAQSPFRSLVKLPRGLMLNGDEGAPPPPNILWTREKEAIHGFQDTTL